MPAWRIIKNLEESLKELAALRLDNLSIERCLDNLRLEGQKLKRENAELKGNIQEAKKNQ
jgi:hypothetical protein